MLEYRTGRYAEAYESFRIAKGWSPDPFDPPHGCVLQTMAAKQLGRNREAESLREAAYAKLPSMAASATEQPLHVA